ncbi:MAG: hypothetical protein WBO46_05935, partial [Caldilineaceae bacterium]
PSATSPQGGGNGGDVTVLASPDILLDGSALLGGDPGTGSGGPDGNGGDVLIGTGDGDGIQPLISLAGPGTLIIARNLTISGGAVTLLDLSNLDPSAISLLGQFLIALGPGGEVDLSENNGLIFVAGQFVVYAEQITLPPGVSLADLFSGPVTVLGSFVYYGGLFLLPAQVVGAPGRQISFPGLLVNLGPVADSYRLEGSFGVQAAGGVSGGAWRLAALPSIAPVLGSKSMLIPLTVTIPFSAAIGSRQPLTITAVSYTDGSVRPAGRTTILVQKGGGQIFLPYVSYHGVTAADLSRRYYLPLIGLENGRVSAGAKAEPAAAPVDETDTDLGQWGLWLPLVGD